MVGMICPPPRWMASAWRVTSWMLKRTARRFSSHRTPYRGSVGRERGREGGREERAGGGEGEKQQRNGGGKEGRERREREGAKCIE